MCRRGLLDHARLLPAHTFASYQTRAQGNSHLQEVASKECWERAKAEVKAREAIRLAEEAARAEEAAEAAAKEEARRQYSPSFGSCKICCTLLVAASAAAQSQAKCHDNASRDTVMFGKLGICSNAAQRKCTVS